MALGSIQPLIVSCADFLGTWGAQPAGTLRVCPGLYRDGFTVPITRKPMPFVSNRVQQVTTFESIQCLPSQTTVSKHQYCTCLCALIFFLFLAVMWVV